MEQCRVCSAAAAAAAALIDSVVGKIDRLIYKRLLRIGNVNQHGAR